MKFFRFIQISNFLSENSACPDDVQDIPEPFHQLYCQYSKLHSLPPKNVDPSISFANLEILAANDEKFDLSISSQEHSYSKMENIQCEYVHDLYSQLLLIFGHFLNYKSELLNHDNESEYLLSKYDNGTLLPILYDMSDDLLYVKTFANLACSKSTKFIETKVPAIKLKGFNHSIRL